MCERGLRATVRPGSSSIQWRCRGRSGPWHSQPIHARFLPVFGRVFKIHGRTKALKQPPRCVAAHSSVRGRTRALAGVLRARAAHRVVLRGFTRVGYVTGSTRGVGADLQGRGRYHALCAVQQDGARQTSNENIAVGLTAVDGPTAPPGVPTHRMRNARNPDERDGAPRSLPISMRAVDLDQQAPRHNAQHS